MDEAESYALGRIVVRPVRTVVDPRKPRGVRHPAVTVVAIAVSAALSGGRGFNAIAEWAKESV